MLFCIPGLDHGRLRCQDRPKGSHFDRGSSLTHVNLDSGFLSSSGEASTNPLNMVKGSASPRLASTPASDAVERSSEVLLLDLAACWEL